MAQKFHFAILRIEVTRASRSLSAIAELLVNGGYPTSWILKMKILPASRIRRVNFALCFQTSRSVGQTADDLSFLSAAVFYLGFAVQEFGSPMKSACLLGVFIIVQNLV